MPYVFNPAPSDIHDVDGLRAWVERELSRLANSFAEGDLSVANLPSAATPLMDGAAQTGTSSKYSREDHRHPTDTTLAKLAGGQQFTGGFTVAPNNLGTIATATINPSLGNYQYGTNNGAFGWTAPATDCAVDILVTNGASAGAIGFTGFTVGPVTGDALTTTNGHKFLISIRRIGGTSMYAIKALQ